MVLVLGGGTHDSTTLTAYSDANWAEDLDDRCSTSGYAFKLGQSTVSWSSKKQNTVAASSTEAEYMAASYCARQALWLCNLLEELGISTKNTLTTFYIDNKGAIDLTKEPRHHQRTKHIDVAHHFVRERAVEGSLNVIHLPTSEMLADEFTKPLARVPFEKMVKGLRVVQE